jgi:hypothetical protein
VVSEAVPVAWDATALHCVDASGDSAGSATPVGPGGTANATFRVAAGETVTCTFVNTRRGLAKVVKNGDWPCAKWVGVVLLPAAFGRIDLERRHDARIVLRPGQ